MLSLKTNIFVLKTNLENSDSNGIGSWERKEIINYITNEESHTKEYNLNYKKALDKIAANAKLSNRSRVNKNTCVNFQLSSKAYQCILIDLARKLKKGYVIENNIMTAICTNNESRVDKRGRFVESLIHFETVENNLESKANIHLYHTAQKLSVLGAGVFPFTEKMRHPFL